MKIRNFVVYTKDYVYAVPYVATAEGIFLKTAFPSRGLEAIYFPGSQNA